MSSLIAIAKMFFFVRYAITSYGRHDNFSTKSYEYAANNGVSYYNAFVYIITKNF